MTVDPGPVPEQPSDPELLAAYRRDQALAHAILALIARGDTEAAYALVPTGYTLPVTVAIAARLNADTIAAVNEQELDWPLIADTLSTLAATYHALDAT